MAERFVELARYSRPHEAHLALGRLEAEGIEVHLSGGEQEATTFFGMGGLGGGMQLLVGEADRERAARILATCSPDADEALEPDWEWRAERDAAVWVCPLCGGGVAVEEEICPGCQTPRGAVRSGEPGQVRARPKGAPPSEAVRKPEDNTTPGAPAPAPVPTRLEVPGEELELPPVATFQTDDLARRAFLSALFGLPVFLFTFYACWLLGRLALHPGELSPGGARRFYAASVLCILSLAFWSALTFRFYLW